MHTGVLEFYGSLQAEEFLDWLCTIKEVLDFKEVPEDKKVLLVATRLLGKVTVWCQQLKLSRIRIGKLNIATWEKMKKILHTIFLPLNF